MGGGEGSRGDEPGLGAAMVRRCGGGEGIAVGPKTLLVELINIGSDLQCIHRELYLPSRVGRAAAVAGIHFTFTCSFNQSPFLSLS